jgi:hypothetical protein
MFPASKSVFGAGVGLDVFHELHCLVCCVVSVASPKVLNPLLTSMCQNIIRKYFYPPRYNMILFEDDIRNSLVQEVDPPRPLHRHTAAITPV